jgi:hypothetical protein
MPEYQTARHDSAFVASNCWHDWTTDDCSGPQGNDGPGYDFLHPCHRHDFGYRNYKRLEAASEVDAWNEVSKLSVDDKFLEDLRAHCSARGLLEKPVCLGMAQLYYWAVRALGT